jgi:class 3 adenylate cyclase
VNTASRAQSVAQAREILATQAVHDAAHLDKKCRNRECTLKGHETPVELYTL